MQIDVQRSCFRQVFLSTWLVVLRWLKMPGCFRSGALAARLALYQFQSEFISRWAAPLRPIILWGANHFCVITVTSSLSAKSVLVFPSVFNFLLFFPCIYSLPNKMCAQPSNRWNIYHQKVELHIAQNSFCHTEVVALVDFKTHAGMRRVCVQTCGAQQLDIPHWAVKYLNRL